MGAKSSVYIIDIKWLFLIGTVPLQQILFLAVDGPVLRCLLSWYQFWFYILAQFSRNRSRALKQKRFFSKCTDAYENLTLTSCLKPKIEQTSTLMWITNKSLHGLHAMLLQKELVALPVGGWGMCRLCQVRITPSMRKHPGYFIQAFNLLVAIFWTGEECFVVALLSN